MTPTVVSRESVGSSKLQRLLQAAVGRVPPNYPPTSIKTSQARAILRTIREDSRHARLGHNLKVPAKTRSLAGLEWVEGISHEGYACRDPAALGTIPP